MIIKKINFKCSHIFFISIIYIKFNNVKQRLDKMKNIKVIENRYKISVVLIIASSLIGLFFSSLGIKEWIFSVDKVLSPWWNIKFYSLLLVSYELFLIITNKNKNVSLLGALIILFSGMIQWNFKNIEVLILLELITVLVQKFLEYKKINQKVIVFIGIIISSILLSFTYIPYVISFGYIFIALIIWLLIKNKANILENKKLNIIGITLMFINLISTIIISVNIEGQAVVNSRYYRNGISYIFNYLYNVLLPFNNVEEKALLGSFISIFPIPMLVSLYYLFSKEKHTEFLLPITIVTVFETIYCISGLPSALENMTLFSKTNIESVAQAVNFANLILIFYFLENVKEKIVKFKNTIRISLVVVCFLIFIERPVAFLANSYLYLFVAELCLLVFLFLNYDDKKYKNVFLFFMCLLTFISRLPVSFII